MPYAGSTGEDQLMADRFASQTKSSPAPVSVTVSTRRWDIQ